MLQLIKNYYACLLNIKIVFYIFVMQHPFYNFLKLSSSLLFYTCYYQFSTVIYIFLGNKKYFDLTLKIT